MRNRNWDRDFEEINQANVNRFHTTRSGERQYDSGYSNPMGLTSFERHMQRYEGPDAYNQRHQQNPPYDNRDQYRGNRHSGQDQYHHRDRHNYDERGFIGRMGERIGDFIDEGRERVEHFVDRFRGQDEHQARNNDHNDRNDNRHQYHPERWGPEQEAWYRAQRDSAQGLENTRYYQGNQGQVQGNRYSNTDYSGRSSYRLLDTFSGYGQSNYSYASDRDA